MLPEPLRDGVGGTIREQCHGMAAFQINEHRAIGVAFPQGEVIDTEHLGVGNDGVGCLRSTRSRVLRLTTTSHAWPSCTPAFPPRAMPRAIRR